MATQEGNSLIGGMSEEPPVERDMDMAEAGEASGADGQRAGKTAGVSFVAANEQWKCNKTGKNRGAKPRSQ
jgi:hypothetical protein